MTRMSGAPVPGAARSGPPPALAAGYPVSGGLAVLDAQRAVATLARAGVRVVPFTGLVTFDVNGGALTRVGEPAEGTVPLDGRPTTLATFDLSRAHVDTSGGVTTVDSALAYLTPDGAARLNALLGVPDLLAPGGLFLDLEATAPSA